jgi:hypothetical protein
MTNGNRPPRRWLSTFGAFDWRNDERAYASLLHALTRGRLETEAVEREMNAPSRAGDIRQAQDKAERDELAEARSEIDDFRAAIADARQRAASDERAEVPYDSRKPTEDNAADVLIQYLVRPGYAEVRTEEPEPGHYVYYIRVDWPRLRDLAKEQGHPITL